MGACFGADERFGSGHQDPNQRRFEQVIARVQVSEEPIALAKGIHQVTSELLTYPQKSFQYSSFSGRGANLKLSAFCVCNNKFMI
jgi:hypothetical protein